MGGDCGRPSTPLGVTHGVIRCCEGKSTIVPGVTPSGVEGQPESLLLRWVGDEFVVVE
jgi:hypothetical protein